MASASSIGERLRSVAPKARVGRRRNPVNPDNPINPDSGKKHVAETERESQSTDQSPFAPLRFPYLGDRYINGG